VDKGYPFLYWAYNIIWIGIVAYVSYVLFRLSSLQKRLDRLERRIGGGSPQSPSSQKSSGS
jgi:CcmD family protein